MREKRAAGPKATVLTLSPAASRMLDILVELGHLDDKMLALVNDRLLDQLPDDHVIDLPAMRRVAASVLEEHRDRMHPEQRILIDKEWAALFH
jgi:hypothetical protein